MSVLRISRPGYPTVLIKLDDGAVGRITHTRGSISGGIAIAPMVPKSARDYPKPEAGK